MQTAHIPSSTLLHHPLTSPSPSRLQVWMEELDESDMQLIATAAFKRLPSDLLTKMIGFTRALQREVVVHRKFGHRGSPWDFNLRDLFRWCELMEADQQPPYWQPLDYVDSLFLQRMRSVDDRSAVLRLSLVDASTCV